MGSWRKVGAFLGLVPDDGRAYDGDDYDHHSEYDDRPEYQREEYPPRRYDRDHAAAEDTARPASKGRRTFADEPVTQGALAMQARPEVRRDLESGSAVRPVTVKLTGFGEARIVGEKFRDGQSVILDMTDMDDSDARRLVDFAAGLAFALRGSIDKVTTKVFMLLPPAEIAAELDEYSRDAALADARRMATAAR